MNSRAFCLGIWGFVSPLTDEAFSNNPLERLLSAGAVIDAKGRTLVIAEVEFAQIPFQMLRGNVVIRADDPAFEDGEISFDRVRIATQLVPNETLECVDVVLFKLIVGKNFGRHTDLLPQAIPNAASLAVHDEMAFLNQHPKMIFQRITTGAGDPDHIADADAAMVAGLIENPDGQFG